MRSKMILSYTNTDDCICITFSNYIPNYLSEAIFVVERPEIAYEDILDWLDNHTSYDFEENESTQQIFVYTNDIVPIFKKLEQYSIWMRAIQ